jgi:hypothetical protein
MNVLHGGLGISKLQFSAAIFSQFLVIKTLDLDCEPEQNSIEMLEPDQYQDPQH